MTRCIVVGGGVSGLAAAIELARSGGEVTLLESSRELGGRARSHVREGFVMNFGPHAVYASARRRLAELGVEVKGDYRAEGLTMQSGGRLAPLPLGAGALLTHPVLTVGDKWRFAKLLGGIGRVDAGALDGVSVATWLGGLGFSRTGRHLVEALVRISTYVHAPEVFSAGAAVRQLRSANEGVIYLDGGWSSMVEALRERAEALGVRVREEARAEAVCVEDGRARGLVLRGGERLDAEAVVLTLSPKACVRLLQGSAGASLEAFAENATAVRAACLDVALSALPRRHPTLILGTDRPLYYSVHSHSAKLAPEGGGLLHVASYLGPGDIPTPAVRAELEELLDEAQPGWREVLVEARWSPAATVMHALPEARLGGLEGRPSVTESGVSGVVLAGDWVGPRGLLLDACLESAREAARRVVAQRVAA